MVDLRINETQDIVRQMVHGFAENEVRPLGLEADRTHRVPDAFFGQVRAIGLQLGPISHKYGGEGDGVGGVRDSRGKKQANRIAAIGAEEMSWGDAALLMTLPGPGLGGPPVNLMGTPEQKRRWLSIFGDPEPRWGAYALTEPGAGSDVSGIRATAVRDGDHYVINGTKCFITNGARASWVVVFATVDKTKGRDGHRAFVVEKGTPGFRVGKIEDKMGLRASETAELVFEDVRVPAENLLGGERHYESKEGFLGAMKTFDNTRPMVAAMAIGIARAAHERSVAFVKENFLVGRPIARYRHLEAIVARNERKLHAARLMVWRAAWMADEAIPNAKEASMSKAYAARAAVEILADAVQVMGAAGVLFDNWVEKWYRDIRVFDIFEGTGQVQRMVISKRILKDLKSF